MHVGALALGIAAAAATAIAGFVDLVGERALERAISTVRPIPFYRLRHPDARTTSIWLRRFSRREAFAARWLMTFGIILLAIRFANG
jgi:hypothetical protein